MKYAKLVNGQLEYPVYRSNMLVDVENGVYILNPKHQHYLAAGFKVVEEKEIDIPEKGGFIIVPVYHEEGDTIVQEWTYEELPDDDTDGYDGTDTDTDMEEPVDTDESSTDEEDVEIEETSTDNEEK